jgi:hypothetical protein
MDMGVARSEFLAVNFMTFNTVGAINISLGDVTAFAGFAGKKPRHTHTVRRVAVYDVGHNFSISVRRNIPQNAESATTR